MNCKFCDKLPIYKCKCNHIYLCRGHLDRHLSSEGKHEVEDLTITLENEKLSEIRVEAIQRLQIIETIKKDIVTKTKDLVKVIIKDCSQTLKKLETFKEILAPLLL